MSFNVLDKRASSSWWQNFNECSKQLGVGDGHGICANQFLQVHAKVISHTCLIAGVVVDKSKERVLGSLAHVRTSLAYNLL
jgi:hypothetical protein